MTCPLSFVTKRGSNFGFESSLVLRRRVNVRLFVRGSVLRDVVRLYVFSFLPYLH